jgi:hypothetical protein
MVEAMDSPSLPKGRSTQARTSDGAPEADAGRGLVIESGSGDPIPVAKPLGVAAVRDVVTRATLNEFAAAVEKLEKV